MGAPVPLRHLPRKTGSAGEIVTCFGRGRFQYPWFASCGCGAGLRHHLVRGPCRGLLKRVLQELKTTCVFWHACGQRAKWAWSLPARVLGLALRAVRGANCRTTCGWLPAQLALS